MRSYNVENITGQGYRECEEVKRGINLNNVVRGFHLNETKEQSMRI